MTQSSRKKRKAVVATSSPYKAELEAAEQMKRRKVTPKRLVAGSRDAVTVSKNKVSGKQKLYTVPFWMPAKPLSKC